MDRRSNLLIGTVLALVIVGGSIVATGFTRRLLSPFRLNTTIESSQPAPAPDEVDWGGYIVGMHYPNKDKVAQVWAINIDDIEILSDDR